jgi:VWFA-related protein
VTRLATAAALALPALALLQPVAAQDAAPRIVIEEPAPGRYVSGEVTLRARVEPAATAVLRMSWSADGKLACAREAPPFECRWDAGPGVEGHVIRVVALLRDGGRLVDSVRTEGAGFAPVVDVDLVQVAATVFDGKGRRVKGLAKEAFRVYEDEAAQEVSHFLGEDADRELVVAVDMSASMRPAMAACRQAARSFVSSLRPSDHMTLLAFNDNVFTVARRDADAAARLRAVDRLRPWGSTALYDVVLKGLDLLERQSGRRALVLFSDGEDQISHATIDDVSRRIEVSDAPVYVIAQGRGVREAKLKGVLDRLAGVSGGRAFYTDSIDELAGVFAEIGEELASQYLLAYDPAKHERDWSWRTIRVEVPGTKYKVRARQGDRAVARER